MDETKMKTSKNPFQGKLASKPIVGLGPAKAMPRHKATTFDDLKISIVAQLKETEDQVAKLEQVFHSAGKKTPEKLPFKKLKHPRRNVT